MKYKVKISFLGKRENVLFREGSEAEFSDERAEEILNALPDSLEILSAKSAGGSGKRPAQKPERGKGKVSEPPPGQGKGNEPTPLPPEQGGEED